jgi:hypothetical protein
MYKYNIKCINSKTGQYFFTRTNDPVQRIKRIQYDCKRVNGDTESKSVPFPRNFIFNGIKPSEIKFEVLFNK